MPCDISVITPTFRRVEPLKEALASALSQAGVTVEVHVIDDSPEQSARAAVESLGDPRVRYTAMIQPTGGRPARVRNLGFASATGRYVHFLDDDDKVVPGAYAQMLAALEAAPEKGMVFGTIAPFGEDPRRLDEERAVFAESARRARLSQRLGLGRFTAANLLFVHPILVNSACLVRRSCVEAVGGYDEEMPTVEDLDFYLRVMRRFGAVFLDRDVIAYRCGAPSLMTAARHDAENQPVLAAYDRIYRKYRETHGALELYALKLLGRGVLRFL